MTNKEKRFKKLFKNPKDTTFSKVKTVLNDLGYEVVRISGSHYHFKKPNYGHLIIPVHNNKITKRYVKDIINKLKHYEKMSL